MAQTKEAHVKKKVRALLDKLGIYNFMPPANGYGKAGIPDIIGCIDGGFLAIECKAGKGQLTKLQTRELSKIIEAGGVIFVAREDNLTELEKLLHDTLNHSRP